MRRDREKCAKALLPLPRRSSFSKLKVKSNSLCLERVRSLSLALSLSRLFAILPTYSVLCFCSLFPQFSPYTPLFEPMRATLRDKKGIFWNLSCATLPTSLLVGRVSSTFSCLFLLLMFLLNLNTRAAQRNRGKGRRRAGRRVRSKRYSFFGREAIRLWRFEILRSEAVVCFLFAQKVRSLGSNAIFLRSLH